MKIASDGYLGYFLKMSMSENRTTEIRRSQGPVYIQKIEIIFKILTLWAAGSATARQSFGLEYFGQASFNLLRQGRLSLDYLGTY